MENLRNYHKRKFDVIVIGGGITGAGIALDAVTRGFKTALFEMQDFAAGTSSRSTKLVHGGLRYLKQFEVKMVSEVGKERAIVYKNGPHVTTPEWMMLPIYKKGTFGKFSTSLGLYIYDYLASVQKKERRRMLTKEKTLSIEPLLKNDNLLGSGYYVEYRTDDARLTIEVLKAAAKHGAFLSNYTKVTELIYEGNKVMGVKVKDQLKGTTYEYLAKHVVNASGPWVDDVRVLDSNNRSKSLLLTKGVHIVIDRKRFPLNNAIYFDTHDKRMIFAIPRDNKTYVGTTDTFYDDGKENPRIIDDDINYLLIAINEMFPSVLLQRKDIESSWSGLRPLIQEEGKAPSQISRKDEIWESSSGLISIAGGKLTGYRKMAEQIVDRIIRKEKVTNACMTRNTPISGGDLEGDFTQFISKNKLKARRYGFSLEEGERLARLYGSNVNTIFQLTDLYKKDHKNFNIPFDLFIQVLYSIKYEMAVKPSDIFVRRLGTLYFNIEKCRKYHHAIAEVMGYYLGWTEYDKERYVNESENLILDVSF
ncbi:glycerol-3-phosphate dehydrogenase/oxidase [Bacillus sp. RD4P76]|uniref:Glycerol-3-phosphate dehydrogenase n=2 Tax=Bacillus suaedaesalsae TaxID=2810349 RepID=A0ABS2DLM4_9BACI|nr:glycerol-3-phosphate dehydrogenase/oxidase [Bacillus suaedaesalsae]MBM6619400.1 glycerol-3-phosphate dehydrogenase/oxidase [Bacillus suaedaesalsae]